VESVVRLLTTIGLFVVVSSAVAGPLPTFEYRTTLRTDLTPAAGVPTIAGETAYQMGASPTFGVIAGGVPDWTTGGPAYPGADFAVGSAGRLNPFAVADRVDSVSVGGNGRYTLDVELRDAAGRVGVVSFSGRFEAGWWDSNGYVGLLFDTIDPGTGGIPPQPVPPTRSVRIGGTLYDVRLDNGWAPLYRQTDDGHWEKEWYPADSVPFRDGGVWSEGVGELNLTVTASETPEPGTLILAGVGVCGAVAAWCRRRPSTHVSARRLPAPPLPFRIGQGSPRSRPLHRCRR